MKTCAEILEIADNPQTRIAREQNVRTTHNTNRRFSPYQDLQQRRGMGRKFNENIAGLRQRWPFSIGHAIYHVSE